MRTLRPAATAIYAVAGMLIVFPLVDFAALMVPLRLHDATWRFAAEGSLSKALLIPFIGLLVALVAAMFFEHRKVLRIIAVATLALAVCLVGVVGLFALDAVQIGPQMRPDVKTGFVVGTILALFKHVVYIVVLIAISLASWKSSKHATAAARPSRNAPPLISREVGQATASTGNPS